MVEAMKATKAVDGWTYWTSNAGIYGTDCEQRAMVTLIGPGLNFPQDVVPPVKGFWSLTMYDTDFFFVQNPVKRYNLSQRNTFVTNPDGSVDLYLQAESPGKDKESNWLPALKGKFITMLRLYRSEDTPPSQVHPLYHGYRTYPLAGKEADLRQHALM